VCTWRYFKISYSISWSILVYEDNQEEGEEKGCTWRYFKISYFISWSFSCCAFDLRLTPKVNTLLRLTPKVNTTGPPTHKVGPNRRFPIPQFLGKWFQEQTEFVCSLQGISEPNRSFDPFVRIGSRYRQVWRFTRKRVVELLRLTPKVNITSNFCNSEETGCEAPVRLVVLTRVDDLYVSER